MPLREYERKRNFKVTPEPPAKKPARRSRQKLRFVIQKHRASHLHYDFRLEWHGVLLSWAVPKGPSRDPSVKRLAMAVEDHPIDYADFEGVIPEGEYGGGTVMVWDRGTYIPSETDVGASWRRGEIKFELCGKKLKGGWVLVRTRGPESRTWLLIKHRDQHASKQPDVVTAEPRSVITDRLLAEIAFDSGGNVDKAASGDPEQALRALVEKGAQRRRRRPKVWTRSAA